MTTDSTDYRGTFLLIYTEITLAVKFLMGVSFIIKMQMRVVKFSTIKAYGSEVSS